MKLDKLPTHSLPSTTRLQEVKNPNDERKAYPFGDAAFGYSQQLLRHRMQALSQVPVKSLHYRVLFTKP